MPITVRQGASALVLSSLLSACGADPIDPVDPGSEVFSETGTGALRLEREVLSFGVSDLEAALDAEGDFLLAPQTDTCSLAANAAVGVAATIDADQAVTSLIVQRDDVATAEGIRVGSTTDEVLSAYADRVVVLDEVSPPTGGAVLVVSDPERPEAFDEGSMHLAFDTDDHGVVRRMRAGFAPFVGYADYCGQLASRPEAVGWPLE